MPYQTTPIIDEVYPQERLVCQTWRTLALECFPHVSRYPCSRCVVQYNLDYIWRGRV